MSVDVKIRIRNEAEILIFAAVEVEGNAIASYEAGVLTNSSRKIAIYIVTILHDEVINIFFKTTSVPAGSFSMHFETPHNFILLLF